ncbi:MAG: NAD(P)/FAD-dependent oxidoreductase [Acidobacteriia bacterium]|nr:NAD(P)/FAD-dependent oxidoreductase [Terriglobia bacterium]
MKYDVAVVGAGPAGSASAILLSRLGFRVALLERQSFPPDKVCGEFLSAEGIDDLQQLGIASTLETLHPEIIRQSHITFPKGRSLRINLENSGWGLSRRALDTALFQNAMENQVQCMARTAVLRVEGNLRSGYRLYLRRERGFEEKMEARAVLAATGRWSNLPEKSDRQHAASPQRRFIGIKAHFRGAPDFRRTVELHFFAGGYCGLNRVERDEVNLCALLEEDFATPFSRDWNTLLSAMARENHHLKDRLECLRRCSDFVLTSPVLFGKGKPVADEMLVVGDASRFLDPFSGDGIAGAIRSARLAASALRRFFSGSQTAEEVQAEYVRSYQKEFHHRFFFSNLVRRSLTLGWTPSLFTALERRLPVLGRWVVSHTRGKYLGAKTV